MKSIYKLLIQYAVQAPSSHNAQPWKFRIEKDAVIIYPDYERSLSVADGDHHELFISLGCALENLVTAARHFGYREVVGYHFNEKEEFIKVNLFPFSQPKECELFDAIEHRQVTRSMFEEKQVPISDLLHLSAISKEQDVLVRFFLQKEYEGIIPLIGEANILQHTNSGFKKEHVSWLRFNDTAAGKTQDGLRGVSLGYPPAPEWVGKAYVNLLDSPEKEARKVVDYVKSSPLLFLFFALKNDKETWVRLGRSYERVALKATALGISHAHVNMPCEEVTVRKKLKEMLGLTFAEPLLLIRLGYSDALPKSFRRPVADVIVS